MSYFGYTSLYFIPYWNFIHRDLDHFSGGKSPRIEVHYPTWLSPMVGISVYFFPGCFSVVMGCSVCTPVIYGPLSLKDRHWAHNLDTKGRRKVAMQTESQTSSVLTPGTVQYMILPCVQNLPSFGWGEWAATVKHCLTLSALHPQSLRKL